MTDDEQSTQRNPEGADPLLIAKKKLYWMSAALAAQKLAPGDITVTPVQPSRLTSRLVRTGRGRLGVVLADMDPTDSVFIFDHDSTDATRSIDFDPTDPI